MAALSAERVRDALRTVLFPGFRRDIVTLGMVGDDIRIDGGRVVLHLRPGTERPEVLAQLRQTIDAALRALPGEQERLLRAAFFGGLSYREVAEASGQPLGTVKTRIRAALAALRRSLSPEGELA